MGKQVEIHTALKATLSLAKLIRKKESPLPAGHMNSENHLRW